MVCGSCNSIYNKLPPGGASSKRRAIRGWLVFVSFIGLSEEFFLNFSPHLLFCFEIAHMYTLMCRCGERFRDFVTKLCENRSLKLGLRHNAQLYDIWGIEI